MKKIKQLILISLVIMFFSGCGSIFREFEPARRDPYYYDINGVPQGYTPLQNGYARVLEGGDAGSYGHGYWYVVKNGVMGPASRQTPEGLLNAWKKSKKKKNYYMPRERKLD